MTRGEMVKTELVVVGAGPAGLGAAIEAARNGVKVTVVDENARPGGQLFKQIHKFFGSREHGAGTRGFNLGEQLLSEAREAGVEVVLDTAVLGLFDDKTLGLSTSDKMSAIKAERILIATGATENSLSFPGWTLPGVMGAGAAQTMIHINRVLPGRRVLMVGSGNVGLIVSYQLMQAGAEVVTLVDAAPKVGGYAVHSQKILRMGVPIKLRHTVLEARGDDRVTGAVIAAVDDDWAPIKGTEEVLDVDVICLAVGLSPLAEMALLAGCRFEFMPELGGHVPWHDEDMQTSVPGIYVAGDVTGVEEASTALEEGRLAGITIAASLGCIDKETMDEMREAVQKRLDAIRQGPFGDQLRWAKQRLVNSAAKDVPDYVGPTAGSNRSGSEPEEIPGIPCLEEISAHDGPVAILECPEEIPCDPCQQACPTGAITVGQPITNLPVMKADLCVGCGQCVAACPGLAVFMVNAGYSEEEATIQIPYELIPLPAKDDLVETLDRDGQVVGQGRVIRVQNPKAFDQTAVVTVAVPKSDMMVVRWFRVKDAEDMRRGHEEIICRCEDVTRQDIEEAIDQGARDLDHIKRLTRAGMGLCQGRTCQRRVLRILSEKTGVPVADIDMPVARFPLRPLELKVMMSPELPDCDCGEE